MRGKIFFLIVGMLIGLSTGCYRQDIQTVTIRVPAMRGPECGRIIMERLSMEGLLSAEPDYEKGRLRVTYDTRTIALKNIEYAITGAGFEANEYPPDRDQQSRLPPACR